MLQNKTIIITGGCGLLGKALAQEIIKQNGTVIIGDINEKIGIEIEKENPSKAYYFKLDTSSLDSIKSFFKLVSKKFKFIDASIHSAYPRSKQWGTKFENLSEKYLKEDLSNQLGGAILFSQQILELFKTQKKGNLIHIASIQGLQAPKFNHYENTDMTSPIEYSAIKAGIINMVRYLSKYYKGNNIRVNAVSLGGLLDKQPELFLKNYRQDCNNKGMLNTKDITGTVIYLLSELSEFVNGQNIIVDDGWSL
ncbi:short-chain dehydrogenase [Candidatus Marinamargulisbacteria bacterium SCGC AG-410-N11]|nr:short-chain dehydrogenase [Candidatus Marinamargulisbacteria bacterium SCGC AG-410-N11]